MTKKTETATGRGDAESAQSKMNELYTAHQVHTLAHLFFQHVAAGWRGARPWTAPGGGAPSRHPPQPHAPPMLSVLPSATLT